MTIMSASDASEARPDRDIPDRITESNRKQSAGKLRMPRLHYIDITYPGRDIEGNFGTDRIKPNENQTKDESDGLVKDMGVLKFSTEISKDLEDGENEPSSQCNHCKVKLIDRSQCDIPSLKTLVSSIITECEEEFFSETNDLMKESLYPERSKNAQIEVRLDSDNEQKIDFPVHVGVDLSHHYSGKQMIGKGKFGNVYKVTRLTDGRVAAAKEIVYRTNETKEGILHEIEILKFLSESDFVVHLYEVIDSCHTKPKTMTIVTEYLEGGDLFDQISQEDLLTETKIVQIMKELLEGVSFIHNKGILHRDIKPENIVYCLKPFTKIKIIDFGFAVHYDKDNPPRSMVGTTIFVAPEVLRFENQSFKTDIWSIGVLTYNLLAGITPFEIPRSGDLERELTDAEIIENIERCDYDFDDDGFIGVSEDAKSFISSILIREPEKRMTLEQCRNHPWLNSSLKPEGHHSVGRLVSVERMKNYKSLRHWEKIGMVIQSVKLFKSIVDN